MRVRRARHADVRFLQRNLIGTLCSWEPLLAKPFVFDVDDAIFLGPRGASANRIARRAALTLCGNQFLVEHFRRFSPVEHLPTAVDTDYFLPVAVPAAGPTVIGWSGSSSGFGYLYQIEDALAAVLNARPHVQLQVVADRAPRFTRLPPGRYRHLPWSDRTEVEALQAFSIGLMPLTDDDWSRGKCSFKMLTYMAAGIPVVVSPVGMNREVLAHGECGLAAALTADWTQALLDLVDAPAARARMGRIGRGIVEAHYSRKVLGPRLARLLGSVG